jgi:predicted helicase
MVAFFNREVKRLAITHPGLDRKALEERIDGFVDPDPTQISWSSSLKQELARNRALAIEPDSLTKSIYRPFT